MPPGLIKVDITCHSESSLRELFSSRFQQGIESIDDIARLCQSDVEAVRTAAREATLSFGKVVQHMLVRVAGLSGP